MSQCQNGAIPGNLSNHFSAERIIADSCSLIAAESIGCNLFNKTFP